MKSTLNREGKCGKGIVRRADCICERVRVVTACAPHSRQTRCCARCSRRSHRGRRPRFCVPPQPQAREAACSGLVCGPFLSSAASGCRRILLVAWSCSSRRHPCRQRPPLLVATGRASDHRPLARHGCGLVHDIKNQGLRVKNEGETGRITLKSDRTGPDRGGSLSLTPTVLVFVLCTDNRQRLSGKTIVL